MALSTPTYSIQVSFTDPYDTPDWVEISRWVKKGSTKRGRQHELQRAVAGTLALTISNQDGRFSTFNTASPYVNIMTALDSYFQDQPIGDTTPGTFTALSNCALNTIANQGYDGYAAMSMTSSAAGTMTATTATGTGGYAVTAGNTYGFMAQFKTAVSVRACSVGVAWYNSGGTQIGSTTFGSTANDATVVYSKALQTATAPAGATTCAIVPRVASAGAANETHYVTRLMISNADSHGNASTAWAPGGRGLVPARPVKVLATATSTTYPVFYGYVDSWLPSYGVIQSDQVLNCSDGLTLLALSYITSSGYARQIIADGATGYWRLGDVSAPFTDSSSTGNSLTASIYASVSAGQTGALFGDTNAAVLVSQGNGGVNFPPLTTGATFTSAAGWTVEVWFKRPTPQPQVILTTESVLWLNEPGASLQVSIQVTTGFVGVNFVGGTSTTNVCDGNWHHLVATITVGGAWKLYVDGALTLTGTGTAVPSTVSSLWVGSPTDQCSEYLDEVAIYPSVLSAAQISAHHALGTTAFIQQQSGQRIAAVLTALAIPSSLQNISTGISAVQAPSSVLSTTPALSYIQTVENTEQGFFYIDESGIFTYRDRHYTLQNAAATTSNGTFANDTNAAHTKYQVGIVPANDALDLWNDWPVSAVTNAPLGVTGAIQNAPNLDSQRWYGKRTKEGYSSMLQTTDTEAASLSQWGVAHYGLPMPRVRQMKLDSTATSPSSLPQMLGRKLWDRITVNWQPIDGTTVPFNQDSLIESIQHDFGPDLWTTTWGLSVAETQQYFTLNSATLGTLAATGATTGNRLGY